MKFTRTIEKYYQTYNSEHKMRTSQIVKSKKIFKKYLRKTRTEQTRDSRNFASLLKEHFKSYEENNFMVNLKKNQLSPEKTADQKEFENIYEVMNVNIPRKIITCIRKHDDFWKTFSYKNLEPHQLYKKYYSIIKKYKIPAVLESEVKRLDQKKEKNKDKGTKKSGKIQIHFKQLNYEEDLNNLYCYCQRPYSEGDRMMGSFI